MADKPISQLDAITQPSNDDLVYIVHDGDSYKITYQNLVSLITAALAGKLTIPANMEFDTWLEIYPADRPHIEPYIQMYDSIWIGDKDTIDDPDHQQVSYSTLTYTLLKSLNMMADFDPDDFYVYLSGNNYEEEGEQYHTLELWMKNKITNAEISISANNGLEIVDDNGNHHSFSLVDLDKLKKFIPTQLGIAGIDGGNFISPTVGRPLKLALKVGKWDVEEDTFIEDDYYQEADYSTDGITFRRNNQTICDIDPYELQALALIEGNIQEQLDSKADLVNGKVPSSQLPSYVDDVIEGYYYNGAFYEDSAHTITIVGEAGKIYVDLTSNTTYRWSGSAYIKVNSSYADNASFNETTRVFQLKSGSTVLSSFEIPGGGGQSIHVADVSGAAVATTPAVNAVRLTWSDPQDVVVAGSVLAEWAGTKLVRKVGSAPVDYTDGTLVIDNHTRNQYATNEYVDTGLDFGVTYYYRWFPYTTTDLYTDGTSISVMPTRAKINTLPSQSGTLTYDGTVKTATFSNYDSTKLDVTGNTGTNAGTYTAYFTPKFGYEWSDGTTTAKGVTWSIGKATGTLSLNPSSVTLNTSTLYAEVTISPTGNGTLSARSNDTTIATVGSITNNKFRISAQSGGSTTVTVSMAESDNYTSATATVSVSVSFISNVLNDNDWATIRNASDNNVAQNYWNVGDCKEITINGTIGTESVSNKRVCVFILGINHNSSVEGNGITFGCFKSALSNGIDIAMTDDKYGTSAGSTGDKKFAMNHWGGSSSPYNTNYGGWKGCDARYDILGSTNTAPSGYGSTPTTSRVGYDAEAGTPTSPVANTFMSVLPSDLRAQMKPITKYTDNKGNSSNVQANVTTSIDYLPLLSEYEVQGARTYANEYEKNYQAQYAYYANGNSKIKYQSRTTSSSALWWLRSPYSSGAYSFCFVNTGGSASNFSSRISYGLAPAFKI